LKKGGLKVLIVEDAAADAELIKYELRRAEIAFETRTVENKTDFLQEIEALWPDLILSDFTLPQFNALDALRILQGHDLRIPFILVTGSTSEEVAVECIKEGADDYLLKSSLKRLPSAIKGLLRKKEAEDARQRAQAALEASEEHFRSLIENSSDIMMIVTLDGGIKYLSPSVERVLGYHPDELIGRNAPELVHENDTSIFRSMLRTDGVQGVNSVEYRFQAKDGAWRVLESTSKTLPGTRGTMRFILNSRDVTERRLAEEQLREQAALLNKASDAIIVRELGGRITFWNQSSERIYGWSPTEALSWADDARLSPVQSEVCTALNRTLRDGQWVGELHQITKSGSSILIESSWSLVRDREGNPKSILMISSDITEKKKLEAHFLRSQRMESIGTLAGGIAHDLNNVLTPILMAIKLLRDEIKEGPNKELLATLETSAHRGAGIVQQVLSFARGMEGERGIFQVKHPLSEVIQIAKDLFPPTIQIRAKMAKDLWPVMGDPTQLHQVLMNLCVNARDAMPHGGRLLIEAANTMIDESYARMQPDAKPGPYVVVTMADTGTGIAPALLAKIFEPFFTTKEVGKGTGLGLSTALGIVKNHGGFLNVYSEVGKGTSFKIHLPASESATSNFETKPDHPLPLGHNELILVVDDESAIREIIKLTLESHGYQVITANDGTDAVGAFAQRKDEIDVVLVDMMMPYMNGPATMRALSKIAPGTRFVAISGLTENEKLGEISDLPNVRFLSKPFTTEQLLLMLAQSLQGEIAT
jgi:PAS domain S-box-containing protein